MPEGVYGDECEEPPLYTVPGRIRMPLGGCKRLLVYSFIGLLVYFEGHLYTRVVHILALHLNTNTLHCVFHVSMFSTMTINLFRFHMFIRRLPLSGVSPEALQGTVPLPAPSVRRGTSQAFKLFIKVFILKVVLQLN